jgi:hypothetical protein
MQQLLSIIVGVLQLMVVNKHQNSQMSYNLSKMEKKKLSTMEVNYNLAT